MRSILLLALFFILVGGARADDAWKFHFEAEKGDMTASLPRTPASLDSYVHKLPNYSPDPLGPDTSIKDASTRVVGTFHSRQIVEARIQLGESFYTDLYLLLYEALPGRYLPIYAQQYHRDNRTPELTGFSVTDRCLITMVMRYSGTGAAKTVDRISLTRDAKTRVQLRCRREQ